MIRDPAESAPVLVRRDGAVATILLNRPRAANAIDVPMAQALLQAAIDCDDDPSIRCVVLTGSGKMFCAGGDIRLFAAAGSGAPRLLKEITTYLHAALSRLARMEKPLITSINGPAAGAGLGLALVGDFVLASRTAHFTLGYGRIGLSPDGGVSWLLPRLIGLRRTQELILTNRRLSADEARQWGMITRVCEPDTDAPPAFGDDPRLEAQTAATAVKLAGSAVKAWAQTRTLLLDSFGTDLEPHLEAESRTIAVWRRGRDGGGIASLRGGRAPGLRPLTATAR